MIKSGIGSLGLVLLLAGLNAAEGMPLSLTVYQEQVRAKHAGYAAIRATIASCRATLRERDTLTTPYFFADGQWGMDESESIEPAMYGESRRQNQWALGLEQQTGFGLNWRLYHQSTYSAVNGANPMFVPMDEYNTGINGIEISQDLWRNGMGAEVMAAADALEAQTRARLAEAEYQERQILVQTEVVYWQLSLARETVRLQNELLQRAQKLNDWVANRVSLKLQDQSDMLQAQSQLEMRRLELASIIEGEHQAARAFNLMRSENAAEVTETLSLPLAEDLQPAMPQAAAPVRKDLEAMKLNQQAGLKDAARKQSALQPELRVRASLYLNGLDEEYGAAAAEALKSDYPTYGVGLQLRLPLDYFGRQEVAAGYARETDSAALMASQRQREVESEWQELNREVLELQARWQMARRLEALQQRKADYERQRLRRGNSITFQVLQFEQDLGQSQLMRVTIESQLLARLAQIKLFGE